jgi:hypothetical protein
MGSGVGTQAAAETAGQAHQIGVVQRLVRAGQLAPPEAEAAGNVAHREIGIQHDAVNAVVTAAQEVMIASTQPIHCGGHATSNPNSISNLHQCRPRVRKLGAER